MNEHVVQIVSRIKELREILDLSVEEMAKKVGVSVVEYQDYENLKNELPISLLYKIAAVLNVDATVLLTGEAPRMNAYTIVRKGTGVSVERYPGYAFSSLAFNYQNRDMEPLLVSLDSKDEPAELVSHGGQEFNYVLEGKVCVVYGKHEFILNAGDCIYFDPTMPHGQKAVDGPAQFITIINE